jgi:hypothetical protein
MLTKMTMHPDSQSFPQKPLQLFQRRHPRQHLPRFLPLRPRQSLPLRLRQSPRQHPPRHPLPTLAPTALTAATRVQAVSATQTVTEATAGLAAVRTLTGAAMDVLLLTRVTSAH